MPLKTSHSSMSTFRRCPHKYYLSRQIGLEAVEGSRAPDFGNAFHLALNEYHRGREMCAVTGTWSAAVLQYGLGREDEILGRVLLTAYATLWGELEGGREVEHEFTHQIIGPDGEPDEDLMLRGFIDVLQDGKLYDHKTTSANLTPSKLAEMARNPQALEYLLAAPEGCTEAVWDVIRVQKVSRRLKTPISEREFYKRDCKGGKAGDPKPGTYLEDETWEEFTKRLVEDVAANPEQYFARVPIRPTEDELDKRRYDIWATSKQMQRAIEDQAFPRNERACMDYGGCEFRPVCWEGVDPMQSELYQIRKGSR